MKKILYFNTAVGSKNLGDYVINYSIKKKMDYLDSKSFVLELPSHTKTFGFMQRVLVPKLIKSYNEFDYKFFCGTNALYTCMIRPNPNWKISLWDMPVQKDVILLGVGLGMNREKFDAYTKRLWKKVLSKRFVHSVRDKKTQEYLEKIGLKAIYTGCPTTWGFTAEFLQNVPKTKSDSVVFTLTSYTSDKEWDLKMIDILFHNYKNLYFFPQSFEDLAYLRSLISLETFEKIQIIGGNLDSLDKVLSNIDTDYIGSRLHGGMFALQHKKRTIVVAIDYRAENMLGNSNVIINRKESTPEDLNIMINKEFTPVIDIPFENIEKWKSQFTAEY